jgi:Flp pilus assembly pilin Flp
MLVQLRRFIEKAVATIVEYGVMAAGIGLAIVTVIDS